MHEYLKNPAWYALVVASISLLVSMRSCHNSSAALTESRRQHTEDLTVVETHRKQDVNAERQKELHKKASLIFRDHVFKPMASNSPTVVALFNEGQDEGLIQKVEFSIKDKIATPNREDLKSKGPTIPINFTHSNYVTENNTFVLALAVPGPAPGKEWTALEISIVQPEWLQNTYIGTLTVYYDGGKSVEAQNVHLDVLAKTPVASP